MALSILIIGLCLVLGAGYEWLGRRRERQVARPERLVDLGGRSLHVSEQGQGGPTVVVITGSGDASASWVQVQREVSRTARVITYDRPGLGFSEAGSRPTAAGFVADLAALLAEMKVPRPYILVGHSLGGLIARAYASRFPNQVAGLVLVDSTPEAVAGSTAVRHGFAAVRGLLKMLKWTSPLGLVRIMGAFGMVPMIPESSTFKRQVSRPDYARWRASVHRTFARGAEAEYPALFELAEACSSAAQPEQFGSLPLAVLASPTFGQQWIDWQRELATRSRNATFWLAPVKGHNLHMTNPEMVVATIQKIIAASKIPA